MKRGAIWTKTLLVAAGYVVLIAAADWLFFRGLQRGLALALSFGLVQTAAIVAMLAVLLTRRGVSELRAARSQHVTEAAAAAIAEHAAGMDRLRVLRDLRRESPRNVDRALGSFLANTRGSMRERVGVLARELAADTQTEIARDATASLFDRALLAHDTRSHAIELAQREIPRALASGEETSMIAALDLLRAWRLALTVPNFAEALTHESAEVRRRAFLALPYVSVDPSAIATGLRDLSPLVRAAAANAAGKLRIADAVPSLEPLLGDPHHDVALAAAFALATTPAGHEALQRRVLAGNRIAFEAIEKAAIGRLDFA